MGDSTRSVTVLAFGSAATILGWTEQSLPIAGGETLAQLVDRLEQAAPQLAGVRDRVRFAVNQRYATAGAVIQPGDEIAIIPPVSGG